MDLEDDLDESGKDNEGDGGWGGRNENTEDDVDITDDSGGDEADEKRGGGDGRNVP